MGEGGKRPPLAPILLVIVLVWAAVAGYLLSSTQSSVERTSKAVPGIQTSLSQIEQNTKATSQVTELKKLNEQVLKEVKPLQPVLEDLNADSAKLARITDSILSTSKGAGQQAKKNEALVTELATAAAESDRIINTTATSATGVQKAIDGMVSPGRSTLRNTLETEPSIGSVNLQVDAIVKDLDTVLPFVVKAIKKAAIKEIDKIIRRAIGDAGRAAINRCKKDPTQCGKDFARYCEKHGKECVELAADCLRNAKCKGAVEKGVEKYCEKNEKACAEAVLKFCKADNAACNDAAEKCQADPACAAAVQKACTGKIKNKLACLAARTALCEADKALPFCGNGVTTQTVRRRSAAQTGSASGKQLRGVARR